jgi:hypothetical protein
MWTRWHSGVLERRQHAWSHHAWVHWSRRRTGLWVTHGVGHRVLRVLLLLLLLWVRLILLLLLRVLELRMWRSILVWLLVRVHV